MLTAMRRAMEKYNDGLLKYAKTHPNPGVIVLGYDSITDLMGEPPELTWEGVDELARRVNRDDILWDTYERLDRTCQFALCVEVKTPHLFRTTAHEDDGGECDTSQFQLYIDAIGLDKCGWCGVGGGDAAVSGGGSNTIHGVQCEGCGETLFYCCKKHKALDRKYHSLLRNCNTT